MNAIFRDERVVCREEPGAIVGIELSE